MVFKKTILIILLAATVLGVAVFSFGYFPKNSFAFGLKIANQKMSGFSKGEAKTKLEDEVNKFLLEEKIKFIFSSNDVEETLRATPEEIGINFDIEETLEEPFKVGKNDEAQWFSPDIFFQNFKAKIFALQGKYNFPLKLEISNDIFEEFLTKNFGKYEVFPKNAELVFSEKTLDFEVKEPKDGLLFEREKIKEEIKKDTQNLKLNDVYLVPKKTSPEIGIEQINEAKKNAEDILDSGPYLLSVDNRVFLINKKVLGNWFLFLPQEGKEQTALSISLDEISIGNYLVEISSSVDIEPKNPVLSFKEGNLSIISPPKTGRILDVKGSIKEIQEKILKKETKIILSLEKTEPKITEAKIEELQIETLVGKGVSNFSGSPKNRVHNIKIGTSKFNGVLIGPGEEFSFNKTLGEVGPAQGYLPELVIKKDKTVPEYGGGICQISTTMFRVAVYSGMKILERRPHAFPVKYYSWPHGQGFDATVYLPSPDLRFKNNTPGYILIQSKVEGNYLTFEFYGKDDKRKVVVKGPYQYDIKSDGSMKAKLHQEVWKDKKLILQKTFLSFYKSPKLYPVQRNSSE